MRGSTVALPTSEPEARRKREMRGSQCAVSQSMITSPSLIRSLRITVPAALLVLSGAVRIGGPGAFAQAGPCGSNPIVCENLNAGTPGSQWDLPGGGDASILGFASGISGNH